MKIEDLSEPYIAAMHWYIVFGFLYRNLLIGGPLEQYLAINYSSIGTNQEIEVEIRMPWSSRKE